MLGFFGYLCLRMPLSSLCIPRKFQFKQKVWPLRTVSARAHSVLDVTLTLTPTRRESTRIPFPLGTTNAENGARGRIFLLSPLHMHMLHWPITSITEHRFKDNVIKSLKTTTAEH